MFTLWCYITPVIGAVIAEQYLGRLKTIKYASAIYTCGLATLFLSSFSFAQDIGLSLSVLLLSLFLIGIGAGGIKSNIGPLIAEQYTGPEEAIRVLGSGEKVLVDKDLTIQKFVSCDFSVLFSIANATERIFTTFLIYINIGSLAASSSTAIEQKYGFSATFALSTTVFLLGFIIALSGSNKFIDSATKSSIILDIGRAFWIAIKHKGNPNYVQHIRQAEPRSIEGMQQDNTLFTDDMKRALSACKVFLLYPFFWAAYSQFRTNIVSQAATMETHGIPNDLMTYINPITSLILLPTLDRIIFPFLRWLGLPVGHANRMIAGFLFCGLSMLYVAFVQRTIYEAPPCYDHPRAQECMGGRLPNEVSVFLQAPAYILITIAETLASVAGMEYAYTKAPKSMRSLVMAVYLSTVSLGILIALAVSPLTADPKLGWMYFTFGMEAFLAGAVLLSARM